MRSAACVARVAPISRATTKTFLKFYTIAYTINYAGPKVHARQKSGETGTNNKRYPRTKRCRRLSKVMLMQTHQHTAIEIKRPSPANCTNSRSAQRNTPGPQRCSWLHANYNTAPACPACQDQCMPRMRDAGHFNACHECHEYMTRMRDGRPGHAVGGRVPVLYRVGSVELHSKLYWHRDCK